MTQKGLSSMLIIILIATATFGYLIYFGKITTINWKEYKNKDYSFKYPNNWQATLENSFYF